MFYLERLKKLFVRTRCMHVWKSACSFCISTRSFIKSSDKKITTWKKFFQVSQQAAGKRCF